MPTRYVAKMQFKRGENTVQHSTPPREFMTQTNFDALDLCTRYQNSGWELVPQIDENGDWQDWLIIVADRPQHVVDRVGVQMALDVDELISGK